MQIRALLLSLAALTATGCALRRYYAYPMPAGEKTPETLYQNLMACATEQNLASREMLSRVFVDLSAVTHLIFELEKGGDSRVTVRLDQSGVNAADTDRAFTAAKLKGDDLLACAKAKTPIGS